MYCIRNSVASYYLYSCNTIRPQLAQPSKRECAVHKSVAIHTYSAVDSYPLCYWHVTLPNGRNKPNVFNLLRINALVNRPFGRARHRWAAVIRMEFGKVSAKQPDPEPQAWIYETCVSPFRCCQQSRHTETWPRAVKMNQHSSLPVWLLMCAANSIEQGESWQAEYR
jgi:hypothetical protein